jgi:hypothetical protein
MGDVLAVRNRTGFDPQMQPLTRILLPSLGAGDTARVVTEQLHRLASNLSPTIARPMPTQKTISLEERLHNALGTAKVLLSQVSMHLDKAWRDKLFQQLDCLLDVDSWDEADDVLDNSSFATFLRMILYYKLERRPALGLSYRGHLLADWTVNNESLTIEFLPKDEVRWVLAHVVDGDRENAAGHTQLARLGSVLAPYDPKRWFANAKQP